MPQELLRVEQPITWLRTIIRRRTYGIETEFHFSTPTGLLQVAIDNLPSHRFLVAVIHLDCLSILDRSLEERGWTENDRFEVRINDRDEVNFEAIQGAYVRWGPDQSENNPDDMGSSS